MRRVVRALAFAIVGYVLGVVVGYVLVLAFSGNVRDRELEAAMTGAFIVGAALALVGAVFGLVRGGRGARRGPA